MKLFLKILASIIGCLLLLSVFIRYQGIQYLMAYMSHEAARRLPSAIAYPLKHNSCTSAAPITVVSYNILYGSAFIEENAAPYMPDYTSHYAPWSVRAPDIEAHLKSYAPDLIGLQETHSEFDISRIVSLKEYNLVSYQKGHFQYGDAALLFKSSRFDLLDSGQFWLSPTPDLPLAFGFKPLAMLRYVNWAMLSDKQSHFKFLFVNTHFDNASVNKEPSATLFRERIAQLAKELPLIVTGDFNSEANTERYARFSGSKDNPPLLKNVYDIAGAPKVDTALLPDNRIDHLLAGGPCKISASQWRIDSGLMKNNQPLSDHDPVIGQLSFTAP